MLTSPCCTPWGSEHMVGNSPTPREPVRFGVLLKDTDKGRAKNRMIKLPSSHLHMSASQVSFDATVTLQHVLGDNLCVPCVHWYFGLKVSKAAFTREITFDYCFWPIQALVAFYVLFILSEVPLPSFGTLQAWTSQKPMQGRQSNPAQETSQPVIAGSQWDSRVLIFMHQTPLYHINQGCRGAILDLACC